MCNNANQLGKMSPHTTMGVCYEVTNYFRIGFEAYFTEENSYLALKSRLKAYNQDRHTDAMYLEASRSPEEGLGVAVLLPH